MSIARRVFACFVAVASVAYAGIAAAEDYKLGKLEIVRPWSRATPAGAKVAAGYLVVKNKGAEADRLVGMTTDVAGRVEVHEMKVVNNVMTMRKLDDGVAVPAAGEVALAPAGFHLMFLDLKRPLVKGESFTGTLKFEKAGTVEVKFAVEAIGAGDAGGNAHKHH